MRSMRMFALAAVACLAMGGCSALSSLGTTTPAQATTVGAAEVAYTTATNLETVWLKSGKATKAQAAVAKSLEGSVYADVVAGRTATANGDSAAIAVALQLFNQALPAFTAYIATNGGGGP